MEEDSYEKNVVLYAVIGEPKHLAGKLKRQREGHTTLSFPLNFLYIKKDASNCNKACWSKEQEERQRQRWLAAKNAANKSFYLSTDGIDSDCTIPIDNIDDQGFRSL